MRSPSKPALAILALAAMAGCSSDDMGELSLRLATRPVESVAAASAAGQLTVSLGGDEIVIDGIQLVLRKIRLDGLASGSCPDDGEGASACAEVRLGPVLVDLPLTEGAEQAFTAMLPVGTYDRLRFQLHKPSNANADADLVAQHPEM
ncbi:MAG TPA: hypothetical protein VEB59_03155, partial [Gemmatimonadales bacterium]|nr:hypothetical protein [Gemmatimonadales bacterium]